VQLDAQRRIDGVAGEKFGTQSVEDRAEAERKFRVAVEAHEMSEAKSTQKFVCTKTDDHGGRQPFSPPFEEHSRRLVSTGTSAEQRRRHVMLNSNFVLHGEALENVVVPSLSWFQKQRETVRLHSWSCAMLAIAGAEAVLQHGHDETQIDEVSTFNQWCLIHDKEMGLQLVTFEAGGVLVGGTAEKIAAHIKDSWELGAKAVVLMREELIAEGGLALADELAPLCLGEGGGLLKL
jgi:hypothetical protein